MTYAMRRMIALLGLALAIVSPAARAADPVDMLLVLAADVSRSVTEPKFRLQREGAAAAITHPDVVMAMTSGPHRRIAVCFLEWAAIGMQNVVVDWTMIDGADSARTESANNGLRPPAASATGWSKHRDRSPVAPRSATPSTFR